MKYSLPPHPSPIPDKYQTKQDKNHATIAKRLNVLVLLINARASLKLVCVSNQLIMGVYLLEIWSHPTPAPHTSTHVKEVSILSFQYYISSYSRKNCSLHQCCHTSRQCLVSQTKLKPRNLLSSPSGLEVESRATEFIAEMFPVEDWMDFTRDRKKNVWRKIHTHPSRSPVATAINHSADISPSTTTAAYIRAHPALRLSRAIASPSVTFILIRQDYGGQTRRKL
uniref:Uncharacterized protein n=1 Tax=Timema poppense TaxID=170557 RepID=A0A7R9DA51_TIMPO|nr:unnamed protein product [Timema poppensis]